MRVRCAGVCATDLALVRGYMDFRGVPGHEFVGEALEGPLAGRRVVGEINAACGRCARCRAGQDRHCEARTVLGILGRPGAFAEELQLPARNLLPVPDHVPDEHAVFCEPLAAALAIGEQVDLGAGQSTLVVGDGRLGLLCAQALALAGCDVALVGRHPERGDHLPAGIRHLGADLEAAGGPFDVAVEASGHPAVVARVLSRVKPRGTLVLKTTTERPSELDLARLVVDEIRLVGSRCGRFGPALERLARGEIVLEPWIHARFPLERGPEALQRAAERGVLKVLLDMPQP